MTAQRQRIYAISVGPVRVGAPARIHVEVDREVGAHPNKAIVQIYNLSLDHQRRLEQSEGQAVSVEVGHESTLRGLECIFGGTVFRAGRRAPQPSLRTEATALDVISHVEARDGGASYQLSRSSRSYQPAVTPATVFEDIARDLGIGRGNLDEAIAAAGDFRWDEGLVLSGQTSREFTRLLSAFGLRWSVQHGVLQIMRGGTPLQTTAVRLAPGSGLIGSPEPGTRGRVKAKAILTSDIWPGRALVLESVRVTGRYTVRSMKSVADSHTNVWESDLELEAAA